MARDIGQKIIKEAMDKFNNFKIAVTGGSKGDYFNITQTAGALGQQNLKEGRVRLMLDGKEPYLIIHMKMLMLENIMNLEDLF